MQYTAKFKLLGDATSGKVGEWIPLRSPVTNWTFDIKTAGSTRGGSVVAIDGNVKGDYWDKSGMVSLTLTSTQVQWSGSVGFGTFGYQGTPVWNIRARVVAISGTSAAISIWATGR